MAESAPNVVVLAGPNGAGKTTSAPKVLEGVLGIGEFVNADVIAQGLSGFRPEQVGLAAGRIMLARLHDLARQRSSFAFETTLASRTFAPWLADLMVSGYQFHLVFLWLPSADLAVARVAARVREGGHDVPEVTVRRRYETGLSNFFKLYQPMATTWKLCDNSDGANPRLIAFGELGLASKVADSLVWEPSKRGTVHELWTNPRTCDKSFCIPTSSSRPSARLGRKQ